MYNIFQIRSELGPVAFPSIAFAYRGGVEDSQPERWEISWPPRFDSLIWNGMLPLIKYDGEGAGDSGDSRSIDEARGEGGGEGNGGGDLVDMRFLNVDPPKIGMIFDLWQEIDVYFNAYGKQQSFGVVSGQSAYKHFKDGSKIKRAVTWKCDCVGKPDTRRKVGGKRISRELEGEPIAPKKSKKKCGCEAMVYGRLNSNGKWELRKVCLSHSHLFSPSKSMLVTKYRLEELKKVSYVRCALHFGNDVGLPNAKLHRWLASQRNGYENVVFTIKDLNNLRLEDGNSAVFLRGLVTDFKFEEIFRNVYTDSKFIEVQRECMRLMYCTGSSMHEISPGYFDHLIKDRVYVWVEFEKKEKPINKWRTYYGLYYSEDQRVEFARGVVYEADGVESGPLIQPEPPEPNPVTIKDPHSKRGPGCVQSCQFVTTVKEDRRQKEERRKKYAAKKARDERARNKAAAKENTDECVVETPQSPHTFTNSIQITEDTVGNDIMDMPPPSNVPPNQFVGGDVDKEGYEDDEPGCGVAHVNVSFANDFGSSQYTKWIHIHKKILCPKLVEHGYHGVGLSGGVIALWDSKSVTCKSMFVGMQGGTIQGTGTIEALDNAGPSSAGSSSVSPTSRRL
uniref:FAR1 domain-containing protein n=1 Tax=Chenopodium quinoa TaxID=63459 RepID=A0A803N6D4_CHEQI